MGAFRNAATFDARVSGDTVASSWAHSASRFLRFAFPAFAFTLPLIAWPGMERPFSSPKLWAWCGATLLLAGLNAVANRGKARPMSARSVTAISLLLAGTGVSAGLGASADIASLLLVVTAVFWLVLLRAADVDAQPIASSLAASASVIAAIALLQFAGLDVWHAMGWAGAGSTDPRMRVYATLGNPNFVGAFLAGVLPLTIALARSASRWQRLLVAAAVVQGLAIAATGSRAAALGAFAAVVAMFLRSGRRNRRKWLLGFASAAILLATFSISSARPLAETVAGRLYVWRVVLPHLSSLPAFGYGPGAFEERFGGWQGKYFRSPQNAADLRFAARFDHAHNDLLEWAVNYGWVGLAILALCLGGFAASALRAARISPAARAAFAGVCALGLIALVDFPWHRPAELFLGVTLMALCTIPGAVREIGSRIET